MSNRSVRAGNRGLLVIAVCLGSSMLAACSSGSGGDGGGTTSGGGTTGSTGGGLPEGAPCEDDAQGDDPCAPSGYVCAQPVYSDGGLGLTTCVLPFDAFQSCDPMVGCVIGLSCIDGFPTSSGGSEALCVQICADNSGCSDPTQACSPVADGETACLPTPCGTTAMNGQGAYFPCSVALQDDGTCLPYGTQAGGNLYLVCSLNGSSAQDQVCTGERNDDAGVDGLCQPGLFCVIGTSNGACEPLCVVAAPPVLDDGGPGCAQNASCYELGDSSGPADLSFGICLQACGTGMPCPSGLTCGNAICVPE